MARATGWRPRWCWCAAGGAWRKWPRCWGSCVRACPCTSPMETRTHTQGSSPKLRWGPSTTGTLKNLGKAVRSLSLGARGNPGCLFCGSGVLEAEFCFLIFSVGCNWTEPLESFIQDLLMFECQNIEKKTHKIFTFSSTRCYLTLAVATATLWSFLFSAPFTKSQLFLISTKMAKLLTFCAWVKVWMLFKKK